MNQINGTWRQPDKQNEPISFIGEELLVDTNYMHTSNKNYTGQYQMEKHISIYEGNDTWSQQPTTDDCAVFQVNHCMLAFDYNVLGQNAHIGDIQGVAYFSSEDEITILYPENCDIQFEFSGDTLYTSEVNCSDYHGAHTYFSGTLIKH